MKLFLFIFLTATTISSCEEFTVLRGTAQPWTSGVTGSPSGTNYTVVVIPKFSGEVLRFDELWINGEYHKIMTTSNSPSIKSKQFVENDTVYLKATKVDGVQAHTESVMNDQYGWMLSYLVNSKRKYKRIEQIEVLESKPNP